MLQSKFASRQQQRLLVVMLSCLVAITLFSILVHSSNRSTVQQPVLKQPTATSTSIPVATRIPIVFPVIILPPAIAAQTAYVTEGVSSPVTLNKNAFTSVAMASTTKIMTAVVAMVYAPSITMPITVHGDVNNLITEASRMGAQPGQVYTLEQLLYGLLLPSGDDAAIAIADGVLGSQDAFVAKMNFMAYWLGLSHTHYVNVHGLDAHGHYTTGADLARLAQFAMSLPLFRAIVATPTYGIAATGTHPALQLTTTNEFIDQSTPVGKTERALHVDGIKTGFTLNAGFCLVSHAVYQGKDVYVVVLGENDPEQRFYDSAALFQWAFKEIDAINR